MKFCHYHDNWHWGYCKYCRNEEFVFLQLDNALKCGDVSESDYVKLWEELYEKRYPLL